MVRERALNLVGGIVDREAAGKIARFGRHGAREECGRWDECALHARSPLPGTAPTRLDQGLNSFVLREGESCARGPVLSLAPSFQVEDKA